eukprot:1161575-Pelagomonas_calceolata.AAC.12
MEEHTALCGDTSTPCHTPYDVPHLLCNQAANRIYPFIPSDCKHVAIVPRRLANKCTICKILVASQRYCFCMWQLLHPESPVRAGWDHAGQGGLPVATSMTTQARDHKIHLGVAVAPGRLAGGHLDDHAGQGPDVSRAAMPCLLYHLRGHPVGGACNGTQRKHA